MATQLFIGRLSYDTTEDTLKAAFAAHGAVTSVRVMTDRDTHKSKGFAFVEMEDDDAAQAAIKALDNKELDGRTIAVSVARPREDQPQTGNNFRGGFQPRG